MKKFLVVLFSIMICVSLVACGTSPATDNDGNKVENNNSALRDEKANSPIDLKLVDSHYVIDNGYVQYTVAIENPNTYYMPRFTHIKVTGKNTEGGINFSDDWVISALAPGSTTYWANQAGDGDSTEDDIIEISVTVDNDDWIKSAKKPDNLYVFDNISVKQGQFGGMKATGEITLTDASVDYGTNGIEQPMLVCVFKNADGRLVGGFNGYVDSDLMEGTPSIFDISCFHDIGEYDKVEMYANPW